MMKELTYMFIVDKNDGCTPFIEKREQIIKKGGEHLYDAIYPTTEKDGKIKATITYRADSSIL